MKIRTLLLLGVFALTVLACSKTEKTGENTSQEPMAKFADEKDFKDAHEKPEAIEMNYKGEMKSFPTPDGKEAKAYALMPEGETDKFLFVIHEWWGLNDHIKKEAERLFGSLGNVGVLALDIYDGKVADNPEKAGEYMKSVTPERAEAIIQGAMSAFVKNGKVATIGWCFGGGWSLRTSIMAGEKGAGCVMYYGMPVEKADELAPLKADILGIFAEKDGWINPDVVNKFENLAKATGKNIEVHQFDADHAFANPSNPKYNKEAAEKANALALAFLQEKLK